MTLEREYHAFEDLKAINGWKLCYFITTRSPGKFIIEIPENIKKINLSLFCEVYPEIIYKEKNTRLLCILS